MSKARLASIAAAYFFVANPVFCSQAAGAPAIAAVPAQAEQDRIIAAMRDYAADYTARLPNFVCQQTVAQFEAGRKPKNWRRGDVLTSRLVFNNGREERQLEAVNNKPVAAHTRAWRAPLTTAGEFGISLIQIFAPESETHFTWAGWEDYAGKRLAKFNYQVDQQHSTLSLSLSDLAKAIVAYRGVIYSDPSTGSVYRITTEALDIPESVRTRSSATTIDYDSVQIGSQSYLLPVKAEVLLVTDTNHIRNEMQFAGYRKWEAESTIHFDGGDGGKPN